MLSLRNILLFLAIFLMSAVLNARQKTATSIPVSFNGSVAALATSIDPSGNVFILGQVDTGMGVEIQSRIYRVNGSWSTRDSLSKIGAGPPALATDSNGNALAIWFEGSGSSYAVFASYYNSSAKTWSLRQQISDANIEIPAIPKVSFFGNQAMAIWPVSNAGNSFIESAILSGQFWDQSKRTISQTGAMQSVDFAIDASGNAFACWSIGNSSPIFTALYNRSYQSWSVPENYTGDLYTQNTHPVIAGTNPGVFSWLVETDQNYLLESQPYFLPLVKNRYFRSTTASLDTNFQFDQTTAASPSRGFLLWQQNEGGSRKVYGTTINLANFQIASPTQFSDQVPVLSYLQLEATSKGTAVGAWIQAGDVIQRVVYNSSAGNWSNTENLYSTIQIIENLAMGLNDTEINAFVWTESSAAYLLLIKPTSSRRRRR